MATVGEEQFALVSSLRRRWERVFAHDFDATGMAHPYTSPGDRQGIVRALRARTGRPEFADPLHHLVRDHLVPIDRVPPGVGCECTDGVHVFYKWSPVARVLGQRVMHGHAHAMLMGYWDHNESDAILLTGELALSTTAALYYPTPTHALEAQRWAEGWLIEAQFDLVRRVRSAA